MPVSTWNDFQVLALLDSLKKIDYTTTSILGGDTIKTTLMLKGAGMVSGIYATSPNLEPAEFPAGKAFLEKFRTALKLSPLMLAITPRRHVCRGCCHQTC